VSPLLLGLFVSLSIVAVLGVAPVYAKGGGNSGGPSYTCSVAVSYASGTFYVKTTVMAPSGSTLPGRTESDYLQSYHAGILFNSQTVSYSIAKNQATISITVPVSNSATGSFSFQSTILNSKGSQLATCSGYYTL
jgi:hypothetical protein